MAPQTYRVKTKKLSARHTAAVRVQSPPAQIADAFRSVLPEVVDSLTRQGVSAAGPPFARFFDYSDELADFEAGFPVAAPVAPEGRVAAGELPGAGSRAPSTAAPTTTCSAPTTRSATGCSHTTTTPPARCGRSTSPARSRPMTRPAGRPRSCGRCASRRP